MRKKDQCTTVEQCIERNTGMTVEQFLNGKEEYHIRNLKEAIKLLYLELRKGTFIFVMSDYDVDGVSSGCIFEIFFRAAGYKNYKIRFPKRFSEGYGIRESVVDEIPEGSLLITVDNGITAINPVKKAKEKNIKVLIIDHHKPKTDNCGRMLLPEADIIVDPHATGGCDFDFYCGAGLAYRLCSSFIKKGHPIEKKMIGFAALGTVADVMPLIEENRRIVLKGMEYLIEPDYRTVGTYALLKAFAMDRYITATDIGYYIAPSINAMSRMNDNGALLAFQTLVFDGRLDEAEKMAGNMHSTNNKRKEMTEVSEEGIEKVILGENLLNNKVLCAYMPGLHEGIIGIIAGNLAQKYKRPTLVFTDNNDFLKGSGRSYGGVNLFRLLSECNDLFLNWGGHEEAAGMSIAPENLGKLRNAMEAAYHRLGCKILDADDTYDLEVTMEELPEVIRELEIFYPYGQGNPPIRLLLKDYHLEYRKYANGYVQVIGKKQEHIKFFNKDYDAIAFNQAKKYHEMENPLEMDLICTVDKNHYVSKRDNQLFVKDQLDCIEFIPLSRKEETQLTLALKEMAKIRVNTKEVGAA